MQSFARDVDMEDLGACAFESKAALRTLPDEAGVLVPQPILEEPSRPPEIEVRTSMSHCWRCAGS